MPLRETLERIRSAPPPENEETTKFQILAPILQDLGWDTANHEEVQFEYNVDMVDKGGRVDIALRGPQNMMAFIEAKKPTTKLKNYVAQVLGQAFGEGVDICVLTNGLEWWLYLPQGAGKFNERRFTILHISKDPINQLIYDLNSFLGKDNLLKRRSKRKASQVLQARQKGVNINSKLPDLWQSIQTEPDRELVDIIRRRTFDRYHLWPEPEQVATMLRASPVQPSCCVSVVLTKPAPTPPKPPGELTKPEKPTGFRLWDEYYSFETWKHMLISVGEALYRRHTSEFDRVLTLQGRKRPHASRNPDDLRAAHQVGSSGIYFEKNLNAKGIEKRSYEFLALFDYPPSDLDIQYE